MPPVDWSVNCTGAPAVTGDSGTVANAATGAGTSETMTMVVVATPSPAALDARSVTV